MLHCHKHLAPFTFSIHQSLRLASLLSGNPHAFDNNRSSPSPPSVSLPLLPWHTALVHTLTLSTLTNSCQSTSTENITAYKPSTTASLIRKQQQKHQYEVNPLLRSTKRHDDNGRFSLSTPILVTPAPSCRKHANKPVRNTY